MGTTYDELTPEISDWIEQQHLFFVSTAPLATGGHINCSPKGLDTFRILAPNQVAYLDLTGSGAETIAHVRENRRMTLMFCALDGPPKIVRLYGRGKVITPDSDLWQTVCDRFPECIGTRSIIQTDVTRVTDSCGYGVPKYQYVGERPTLEKSAAKKGKAGVAQYQRENNRHSIDGLPALDS